MSKRVLIGLFALSVVALLRTDANAGCAVIAGFQICADWITGGSAASVLAVEAPAGTPDTTSSSACVVTTNPSESITFSPSALLTTASLSPVSLKLVGTVGMNCGLGTTDNQTCLIDGVVFCAPPSTVASAGDDEDDLNHTRGLRATVPGPLTVQAAGFSQTDPTARMGSGRSFAGFRFQVPALQQDLLCPATTTGGFQTFVPRKGNFEACVTNAGTTRCLREFCQVKVGGPNDVKTYGCRNIQTTTMP